MLSGRNITLYSLQIISYLIGGWQMLAQHYDHGACLVHPSVYGTHLILRFVSVFERPRYFGFDMKLPKVPLLSYPKYISRFVQICKKFASRIISCSRPMTQLMYVWTFLYVSIWRLHSTPQGRFGSGWRPAVHQAKSTLGSDLIHCFFSNLSD